MAVWDLFRDGDQFALTYTSHGATERCGGGDGTLFNYMEAWVVETAGPWDVVGVEGRGTFVRMTVPRTGRPS